MLRPQDSSTRETKVLDGMWDFAIDPNGVGRDERWWQAPLADARPMPVPASYNDLLVDAKVHDLVGDAWYQRSFVVPRGWDGQRIVLRFDSATHRAVCWVDDVEVASLEGGYLPFEADLTGIVTAGGTHRVTVVVNNELTVESIPPGHIDVGPDGRRKQRYFHDFYNYAGLHRSVHLCCTPAVHIDDLTVATGIDGTTGTVTCTTTVAGGAGAGGGAGEGPQEVALTLLDAAGSTVATATGSEATLRVPDAELWRPGRGYLYSLVVELRDGEQVTDSYVQPVGIRTVEVSGTRFLINGEPFHFRGFGMHEDHLVRGKGHDAPSVVHDFALLGWIGANSLRTSHYPYAEEVPTTRTVSGSW